MLDNSQGYDNVQHPIQAFLTHDRSLGVGRTVGEGCPQEMESVRPSEERSCIYEQVRLQN
jgi:hypothetical protein